MSPKDQEMLAELRLRGDPLSLRAANRFETYFQMDCEAATHVESVIAMRTNFTGDPPFVGWKGLGLALSEVLNRRDVLDAAITRHRANLWGDGPIGHDEDAALYRAAGLPDVVEQVDTDPDDRPAGPVIERRPVDRGRR